MEGLSRILAAPIEVTLAGRCYDLHPVTLRILAMAEQHLLAERLHPVEQVQAGLGHLAGQDDVVSDILAAAEDELRAKTVLRIVTAEEMAAWLLIGEGMAFAGKHCLRRRGHLAFASTAECRRVIEAATTKERDAYTRLLMRVSGLDLMSKCDWPADDDEDPLPAQGRKRSAPWKQLVRNLLGHAGLTLESVGDLTLWQLRLMTCEEKEQGGRVKMSATEFKTWESSPSNPVNRSRRRGHRPKVTDKDFPAKRGARKLMADLQAKRKQGKS